MRMVGNGTLRAAAVTVLASGTMLATPSISFAQDAGERGATLLQRLVIGFGQPKVAVDTPTAVTVIEQEDIDQEVASTTGQLLERIPNVNNTGGADRALGQVFNIRGIGRGESAADEGRIILNVDGMSQFYEQYRLGGFFNDLELYKRIEVLRGPAASTLYGSGALGGVINFTTKDASDFLDDDEQFALRLKGTYETNGDGYLASAILAARMGDNAEFLLAGNQRASELIEDGFGDEVGGTDFKTPSGLIKGTFYLDDAQERVLRMSYSQFNSDEDAQIYNVFNGNGQFFGFVDREVNNRQAQISFEDAATENPFLDYKVSLTWNDISNQQRNATIGGSLGQPADYSYESIQLLGENTFEFSGENWESFLTVGGQIIRQERETNTDTPLGFHPEGTDFQVGFFAQNEFVWNDRLTLIPGVRVDYQRLETADSTSLDFTETDIAFSPKIAALYEFNDNFSVFGSYAHTERFPTLDEMFSNDFLGQPGVPPNTSTQLGKEKSDNFELGFAFSNTDLIQDGDAFDFKATAFYNRVSDLIVRQRRATPQYRNIGSAELYGLELEAAYDSDLFFASAGFGITVGTDLENDVALTSVAPPELSLGAGFRMPEHGLSFGWDGRIAFEQTRVPASTSRFVDPAIEALKSEAFSVHDLYVTWRPDDESQFAGWEGTFRVDNVFDKGYRDFLAEDNGKGRTFKIALSKKFGL
ncbi:MAG: TonB-dependent receptor [Pseudomonadota bacterium]